MIWLSQFHSFYTGCPSSRNPPISLIQSWLEIMALALNGACADCMKGSSMYHLTPPVKRKKKQKKKKKTLGVDYQLIRSHTQ